MGLDLHSLERIQLHVVLTAPLDQLLHFLSARRSVAVR